MKRILIILIENAPFWLPGLGVLCIALILLEVLPRLIEKIRYKLFGPTKKQADRIRLIKRNAHRLRLGLPVLKNL